MNKYVEQRAGASNVRFRKKNNSDKNQAFNKEMD